MYRLLEFLAKMATNAKATHFLEFQNSIAAKIGYSIKSKKGEVGIVKDIADNLDGLSYNGSMLHSSFIHGNKSRVEFDQCGESERCELGDMAIISVASYKREIILQRICIIQNKLSKAYWDDGSSSKDNWKIDDRQNYLLTRFPSLRGYSGVIKRGENAVFSNYSNCLGAYGLLHGPGDMVFASALLVDELKKGASKISRSEISCPACYSESVCLSQFPSFLNLPPHLWDEFMHFARKGRHACWPIPSFNIPEIPFLQNSLYSRNLHSFARNWTFFNIGEYTSILGDVVSQSLHQFTNTLLKTTSLRELVNLPSPNDSPPAPEGGGMGVLVFHTNVHGDYNKDE